MSQKSAKLSLKQKIAFGLGAVGKDMVYALSASYVMFYYQDTLGLSATFVGLILMLARVFDALNDPFMGVLVAKTKTRWGRFRPWLFPVAVLGHHPERRCAVRTVRRAGEQRSQPDGVFLGGVYPVGRYLHHDGYSLLVHDPGRDRYPGRP